MTDWKLDPGPLPPIADEPPRPADLWQPVTTRVPAAPPLLPPHQPPPTPPLPAAGPLPPPPKRGRGKLVAGCAAALLVGLVGGGLAINVFGGDDNDAAAGAGLPSQTTTVLTRPDQPNFRDGERQDGTTEDDPASTEDGAFAEDGTAPSTAPARTPGGGAPPALDESLEPVAAAAAAVKPAVVQLETNRGLGSGFIYDREGLILTAAHVVENARQVTVRLGDGTTKPGEVLGVDVNTDVAVVKIDPFPGMPLASLALEETPVVGQTAIAIGSPYGLDQTVTAGIVSAINRPVPVGNNVVPMVQTDAAINTGNSGGALIDLEGRVIGINDQIRTSSGDNSGIGFAIPIGLAYDVAGRIVRGESLEFGYLGISSGNDTAFGSAGALVTRVEPGSPAERAGLRVGDVVIEIDGDAIRSFDELVAQIRARTPGDKVELTVRRNGEVSTVTATLSSN